MGFSEELADQVLLRTTMTSDYYNPFLDRNAFCDFVNEQGFSFCVELENRWETLDMLSFDFPMAFRIKSSGEYRGQIVNLEALIYDLFSVPLLYQKFQYFEAERKRKREGILDQRPGSGKQQRKRVNSKAKTAKKLTTHIISP